jgi:hypothetical protein
MKTSGNVKLREFIAIGLAVTAALTFLATAASAQDARRTVLWLNHLDFLAGDPSVQTSFNAISSGVGGGLSGLIIKSTTVGDTAAGGGNKVVEMGATEVPPGYQITGVRVCYELSDAKSFITQIRLDQVQNPPASAVVKLDDGTDQTNKGPICVDSKATTVDPAVGGTRLSLRVNFGNTAHRIVVRAVGLYLVPK